MIAFVSVAPRARQLLRLIATIALVLGWITVIGPLGGVVPPAAADTAPPDPNTPLTVSADPLPTVQVDGVVWAQATVGNTVWATGSFTTSWPAGTTKGGPGTQTVGNLIAYDITTGVMRPSYTHILDAQGLSITASPDGSRIYVGGDFSTVDGVVHDHIVAIDAATGAVVPGFTADISGQVTALAATNDTVYAGGAFFNVNGRTRVRLAAMTAAIGSVLLDWRPSADDNNVTAMLLSPDRSRLIVAGHFTTLNGAAAYGIGPIDAVTGQSVSWNPSFPVRNAGPDAAITNLTTDGTQMYGAGYVFGAGGNMEGRFASDFEGNINWINSCHGDSYSTFPMGDVLYSVGHAHDCSDMGIWDDTSPRTWHRALAETTYPTGTLAHNNGGNYYDWFGWTDSTQLHWYPAVAPGTFSGGQGGWSLTGNDQYLAMGGEFPRVNGKAQQGLVRFAVKSIAPNKTLPVTLSTMEPVVASVSPGTASIAWQTTWDYDNVRLTYSLYRDGGTTPIYTTTVDSEFWKMPYVGYTDTGLTPGSTHTYQVKVRDPFLNGHASDVTSPVTIAAAGTASSYLNDVTTDGATNLWRLSEPTRGFGYDVLGGNHLIENTGVTTGAAGPITGDASASTFSGSSTGRATAMNSGPSPSAVSVEGWVRTSTNKGGLIAGFGDSSAASSVNHDRQLYLDNSGHAVFAAYDGSWHSVRSPSTYNNGQYHHVVGTLSANGLTLYVDGRVVARDQTISGANGYTGYWHVGGDSLTGVPSKPTSNYLAGTIANVAVYPTALDLAQVQKHYVHSGRTLTVPPSPGDAYGAAVYQDMPDLYWRVNETSGSTANDSSRGGNPGTYTNQGVTKGVTGAFSGSGTAVTFNGSQGSMGSSSSFANPQVYSEELWFKTTTTRGGKLIGFGSSSSGTSSSVDRHVYMTNSGTLVFGAFPGTQVNVTSPKAYNDGGWHHMVASQGSNGMRLYVDGALVGSNANKVAQNYTGYWRVGGDKVWSGATSGYLAGTIDEVSVYPTELTTARVLAHYNAAGGNLPPAAAFTASCTFRSCAFDSSETSDGDGTIASYSWNFGDGTTSTGASPTHLYSSAGTYTVTLTVTDNKGATAIISKPVTASASPAPVAAFTSSCDGVSCSFDGSGSSGQISSYAWDFGDGTTGSGAQPSHLYADAGTYEVTLTVSDDLGTSDTITHDVVATNQPPTADFTSSCDGFACSFDGSAASDADGTVAGYAWDFGDGATGTGSSATHTFATAGDYPVRLTVTDNLGGTGTTLQTLVVRPPANPNTSPFASDTFNRTVSNGFGTADVGGTWVATGNAANMSVSAGTGTLTMVKATSSPGGYLNGVSATDTEVTATVALDKAVDGNGASFYVVGRRVGTNQEYRAVIHILASGVVNLGMAKLDGSAAATVISAENPIAGLTYTAGMQLRVRFDVTGTSPTTLRARVWAAGGTEPTTWQANATDSSAALQTAGTVGIATYLSGSATIAPLAAKITAFSAGPTNTPPVAAFASNCTALSCSADGSASSDPQGGISSYQWSFGDGTSASGVTAAHTFASAGTYRITLTVTDAGGLTDVTTSTVTVAP